MSFNRIPRALFGFQANSPLSLTVFERMFQSLTVFLVNYSGDDYYGFDDDYMKHTIITEDILLVINSVIFKSFFI